MLIQFSVSNFMSFDEKETFSMQAGKARKYNERIFKNKKIKLTKCKVISGANASGKSNFVSAIKFVQNMIVDGLPRGFSEKYFRLNQNNKKIPSEFEIQILCNEKVFVYYFSINLSTGCILSENLSEKINSNSTKLLFDRDTLNEKFIVGDYFKKTNSIKKLCNYGEDSIGNQDILFLSIINMNKEKMFMEYPELRVLKDIFDWFDDRLNISFPNTVLTGYPYFTDANIEKIADLLDALDTGISELKIVKVPIEIVKNKIPEKLFNRIITDLEKTNSKNIAGSENSPSIMARSYKEFYTFKMNQEGEIEITTIEFSHENKNAFFDLNEESDGTARLLDLIEILFGISNNKIFVIDEIDRCLHPLMTVKIIELFLEMAKERNTQLIVTSHESRLLATDILRNDEICFVKKMRDGSSIIVPLDKYQLRADKNVYAALFDGTVSAVPKFKEEKIEKLLDFKKTSS